MEGDGFLRGRVEYCNNGTYKAICYDDSWDARDASVVCRQLGFAQHGKGIVILVSMCQLKSPSGEVLVGQAIVHLFLA